MRPGRFLLTPVGSGGDVHPYVGIGRELQRRGHDVVVLTSAPYREVVESAGLDFHEALSAELFFEGASHPDLWHPRKGLSIVLELARVSFEPVWEGLERHFTGRDTVVVSHALALGARAFQLAHAPWSPTVHLAPSAFRSEIRLPVLPPDFDPNGLPRPLRRAMWWLVDHLVIDREIRRWLDPALERRGLPVATRVFGDWIHSDAGTIGLFPDWFGEPQADWPQPLHLTGFPLEDGKGDGQLSAGTRRFLDEGIPPVVFTLGTENRAAVHFFQRSLEAIEGSPLRAIFATKFDRQLPASDPTQLHTTRWEPFAELLPRCSAIVHHGGIGTTAQAMSAGIPQIVHPLGFDQADNGARVEQLGVGRSIPPTRYLPSEVRAALSELTADTSVATRAAALAERVRGRDGISAAADVLERALPD